MKTLIFASLLIFAAFAVDCPAGQYDKDGTCTTCVSGDFGIGCTCTGPVTADNKGCTGCVKATDRLLVPEQTLCAQVCDAPHDNEGSTPSGQLVCANDNIKPTINDKPTLAKNKDNEHVFVNVTDLCTFKENGGQVYWYNSYDGLPQGGTTKQLYDNLKSALSLTDEQIRNGTAYQNYLAATNGRLGIGAASKDLKGELLNLVTLRGSSKWSFGCVSNYFISNDNILTIDADSGEKQSTEYSNLVFPVTTTTATSQNQVVCDVSGVLQDNLLDFGSWRTQDATGAVCKTQERVLEEEGEKAEEATTTYPKSIYVRVAPDQYLLQSDFEQVQAQVSKLNEAVNKNKDFQTSGALAIESSTAPSSAGAPKLKAEVDLKTNAAATEATVTFQFDPNTTVARAVAALSTQNLTDVNVTALIEGKNSSLTNYVDVLVNGVGQLTLPVAPSRQYFVYWAGINLVNQDTASAVQVNDFTTPAAEVLKWKKDPVVSNSSDENGKLQFNVSFTVDFNGTFYGAADSNITNATNVTWQDLKAGTYENKTANGTETVKFEITGQGKNSPGNVSVWTPKLENKKYRVYLVATNNDSSLATTVFETEIDNTTTFGDRVILGLSIFALVIIGLFF